MYILTSSNLVVCPAPSVPLRSRSSCPLARSLRALPAKSIGRITSRGFTPGHRHPPRGWGIKLLTCMTLVLVVIYDRVKHCESYTTWRRDKFKSSQLHHRFILFLKRSTACEHKSMTKSASKSQNTRTKELPFHPSPPLACLHDAAFGTARGQEGRGPGVWLA